MQLKKMKFVTEWNHYHLGVQNVHYEELVTKGKVCLFLVKPSFATRMLEAFTKAKVILFNPPSMDTIRTNIFSKFFSFL